MRSFLLQMLNKEFDYFERQSYGLDTARNYVDSLISICMIEYVCTIRGKERPALSLCLDQA